MILRVLIRTMIAIYGIVLVSLTKQSAHDVLRQRLPGSLPTLNSPESSQSQSQCRSYSAFQPTNTSLVTPVSMACFPGSGSELFRDLVTGLTGIETDEVYNSESSCNNNPVVCKTHYPLNIGGNWKKYGPAPKNRPGFSKAAVILIRNPAHAIASHYNYKFEGVHKLKSHSIQGSEESWREWRNRRFEDSIFGWEKMVVDWEMNGAMQVQQYVPYEQLVDATTGPALLKNVGDILVSNNQGRGVTYPNENDDASSVACVWENRVMQKTSVKRIKSYTPGYTAAQQKSMLDAVERLLAMKIQSEPLRIALESYQEDISNNLKMDK